MESYNDILNELSGMNSPLAGMSREMPYRLPECYFDWLPAQVSALIHTPDITMPDFGTKKIPFEVPEGYFEQLQTNVLQQVQHDALTGALPKINVFTAPEGYFDTLPAQVLAQVQAADTPAVKRTRIISWQNLRWAAAAVLVLGLGFGSVKMLWPDTHKDATLAKVPATAIQAYVQQNIDEFDSELIENNIASNITLHSQSGGMLNAVDKDDIIQYLNENGWEEPASTN